MTAFYLAGPYALRDELAAIATYWETLGHSSTAGWLRESHAILPGTINAAPDQDDAYVAKHVSGDFADIDRADVVVLITSHAAATIRPGLAKALTTSGGRHVETGYALAKTKPVIVVGEPENIFHRGPGCFVVVDLEGARERLLEVPSR